MTTLKLILVLSAILSVLGVIVCANAFISVLINLIQIIKGITIKR